LPYPSGGYGRPGATGGGLAAKDAHSGPPGRAAGCRIYPPKNAAKVSETLRAHRVCHDYLTFTGLSDGIGVHLLPSSPRRLWETWALGAHEFAHHFPRRLFLGSRPDTGEPGIVSRPQHLGHFFTEMYALRQEEAWLQTTGRAMFPKELQGLLALAETLEQATPPHLAALISKPTSKAEAGFDFLADAYLAVSDLLGSRIRGFTKELGKSLTAGRVTAKLIRVYALFDPSGSFNFGHLNGLSQQEADEEAISLARAIQSLPDYYTELQKGIFDDKV
jgi:hypothetical protein